MRYLLLIPVLFLTFSLGAQNPGPWIKFEDPKTRLAGYKDLSGQVRIPAKFENYFVADTFHNIIAVREPVGKTYESYYLLKNGAKTAHDSLYLFDGYDCESDDMIIYQDHKTGYVGYLNTDGAPVIPAVYNTATRFRNGLAQALVFAKKRCWEGESWDTTDCEREYWDGGKQVLINKQNEVVAERLTSDFYQAVDWYSLRVNDAPKDTSIYIKVDGKDGKTYYFVHLEKEFRKWFTTEFLAGVTADKSKYLFDEILIWNEKEGWRSVPKEVYLKTYSQLLTKESFEVNEYKKFSFAQGEYSDDLMTSKVWRQFFTACGKFDKYRYPFYLARYSYYNKDGTFDHSESFEFVRTAKGYRLVNSPTLKSDQKKR